MNDIVNVPIEVITERDMDLLFLEEITISRAFAEWLIQKAFPEDVSFAQVESANHSVADEDGESDLIIRFRDAADRPHALLIENKVNAPPQPDQAARYRLRAKRGELEFGWKTWKTCLVAPASYLSATEKASGYDSQVSYEAIAKWFEDCGPLDIRAAYRARLIGDAIARARRTGISKEDPVVTEFWKSYWTELSALFPELEMKEPTAKGPASTWITFNPSMLEGRRTVDHKLWKGTVDLTMKDIQKERLAEAKKQFAAFIDARDMTIEATGEVVATRVKVPPLDVREDFKTQINRARQGMRAAYRLLYLSPILRFA